MTEKDYIITKCDDCLRVTYISNHELHTHVHSKRISEKLIKVACGKGKIPLDEDFRFYESLYRILPDECEFKNKVYDIMQTKSKKRDYYYNPGRKKSGGNF